MSPARMTPARFGSAVPAALPALLALAVFGQVIGFGFVSLDDPAYVSRNPNLAGGLTTASALWALTATHAANWHPVTWVSHLLDVELFGLNAGGHHASSLLLHVANTWLLYRVLRLLTGAAWRSALVAALFAAHPLQVESVAWVAERKNLLAGFFWLLTVRCYAGWLRRGGRARYAAMVASFLLGLGSKAVPVVLPLVLLLLDWWPLGRFGAPRRGPAPPGEARAASLVLEKIPLLCASAAAAVAAWLAQAGGGAVAAFPLPARLANAADAVVRYVGHAFWPAGLSVFYPHPLEARPLAQTLAAAALIAAVTAFAARRSAKAPWVAAGWGWFLVALAPSIGLVQLGAQAMADRYAYLPLVGLFVAVVWSIPAWRGGAARAAAALAAAVAVSALGAAAWTQTRLWGDDVALYRHSARVVPANWGALTFLGDALLARGDVREAETALRRAVEANPAYFGAHYHLGRLLALQGREREALVHLRRAAQISPVQAERLGLSALPGLALPEGADR